MTAFGHGVASGDPLHDAVIIWTRVTTGPDALPGSGVGPDVDVEWEVSTDATFSRLVAGGTAVASAARDHTVKVDVTGLVSGSDHWYRFRAIGETSPVGRTRTAPAPGSAVDSVRFGVVSCSEFEFGYFGAYRHLAARDDIEAVLHLGDYIYEFGVGYGSPPSIVLPTPGPAIGRRHDPPTEIVSLAHYRTRFGQYHRDPDTQALHAAHPVIVMWDDHEFANDAWRDGAQNHQPNEGTFAARAAAARQAFREWLPIREVAGDVDRTHRHFRFGNLVELWMLDERRFRDQQPANLFISYGSADPAIEDPARTMLGTAQRNWLTGGLETATAAWKVLGNPVPFFPLVIAPAQLALLAAAIDNIGPGLPLPPPLTVDDWNGYAAERRTLTEMMATRPVKDVVILTGDYHESFASDIPRTTATYAVDGNSVAVEFVVPAVTSPGLGETLELGGFPEGDVITATFEANLRANNPWVRYHEGEANGFGVVEFTAARTQYDFVFLANRMDARSTASVAASWETRRGTAKAVPAAGPLPARSRPASAVPERHPREDTGVLPATGRPGAGAALGLAAAAAAAMGKAVKRSADGEPEG